MSGEFTQPAAEVNVEMSEWDSLQGQGILHTDGLSTCIGVSIYDPSQKRAHLGHFIGYQQVDIEAMIADAKSKITEMAQVRVWVGGGTAVYEDEHLSSETARNHIVDVLTKELGQHGASIREDWLDVPGDISYEIDVATGEEIVETETD